MVTFRGNTNWEESTDPLWSVDNWGMDQCRVSYRGARTTRKAFEDSLKRWDNLPGYSLMRLASWSTSNPTVSFPEVELLYIGFRDGSIPPPKSEDGTSLQTAQGQGTDPTSGQSITGSFTYQAARTTWTWFEKATPPAKPRYATVRDMTDPLSASRITAYSFQDSNTQKRVNSIPYSAFVTIFNSLLRRVVVADYHREMMIPNTVWACRADVDYRVIN